MAESLNMILTIIIYIGIITLLIIFIIAGIRLSKIINKVNITMEKLNVTLDSVNNKLQSFDSVFNIADVISNKLGFLSDIMVDKIMAVINKMFKRKKEKEKEEEIDE